MLKISSLAGKRILLLKKTSKAKDGSVTEKYQKLGRVRTAVFSPDGLHVVGYVVKRPDVAGMIKRGDAFVAYDSLEAYDDKTLVVTRAKDGLDDAALKRLNLDWDRCIIWSGMDAKTADGTPLGYVSDAEYDEKTGEVTRFFTADGGMARALIGSFVITAEMVVGYRGGCMVVDPGHDRVKLDGGIAGAAGEGYARAKAGASKMGKKAGAMAGEAVDKGSFALGKMLGKAGRAIADATAPEDEAPDPPAVPAADVRVEKPAQRIAEKGVRSEGAPAKAAPKTYAPASKPSQKKPTSKPASKKAAPSTSDKVARAAGRQLSGLGKMFGSFKDEFDKASK